MSRSRPAPQTDDERRDQVRARYAALASGQGCCGNVEGKGSCCADGPGRSACGSEPAALDFGYSKVDLASVPAGANLGLGCGNPTALLALRPRQVVLDLGSGAGIDCFLAARKVGPRGRVIGVDMTPEMVATARENARRGGFANVEFRLGEIEHLPVADRSVDVVISNCVINLAPEKAPVYEEAFRVLRPGGELAISDVVATRPISASERRDPSLWSSCSSGALEVGRIMRLLRGAGFTDVRVRAKGDGSSPRSLHGQRSLGVVPADIHAVRPVE